MSTQMTRSAGSAPLEKLPAELLGKVLLAVTLPGGNPPRNDCGSRSPTPHVEIAEQRTSLFSCLLASTTLHAMTLSVMYRYPKVTSWDSFEQLSHQVVKYPHLGRYVRGLNLTDLCQTPLENCRSAQISSVLDSFLTHTPLLREFRFRQEHPGDDFLDGEVVRKLFCDWEFLEVLELVGCIQEGNSYNSALLNAGIQRISPSIKKLNLNGCNGLSSEFFQYLLPQLSRLESIDVSNTQITVDALATIPTVTNLSSLYVNYCELISGPELARFISTHPSTRNSLISLKVQSAPDIGLFDDVDITTILSNLPPTLISLDLTGSDFNVSHVPHLRTLAQNLEHLTLGSQLRMRDVEDIILSPAYDYEIEEPTDVTGNERGETGSKFQSVMAPMEDAVAVCKLRQRINTLTPREHATASKSALRHLDISSMSVPEQSKIRSSVLLGTEATDLDRIVISQKMYLANDMISKLCKAVGWRAKNNGRRYWLERKA